MSIEETLAKCTRANALIKKSRSIGRAGARKQAGQGNRQKAEEIGKGIRHRQKEVGMGRSRK